MTIVEIEYNSTYFFCINDKQTESHKKNKTTMRYLSQGLQVPLHSKASILEYVDF